MTAISVKSGTSTTADEKVMIGAIRGRGEKGKINQNLEISQDGFVNNLPLS